MLKRYIKDIVKTELTKQKLNHIYGSARSYNLNSVSDKERQQYNEEISILKNHNDNIIERNKYLQLQLSQEKNKYDDLLKCIDESYKKQSERINELEQQLEDKSLENGNLQFNSYSDKYEINILQNENEKLKQENEQLKNISCSIVIGNDGKLDSLFNKQLRKENEQLKESIENIEGKLILKANLLSEQKQENKKLEDKLSKISNVVSLYNTNEITFMSLMSTIDNIRNILKES